MEKKRREVKTSGREEENKMKEREKKKENREKDHKIIKKEKKKLEDKVWEVVQIRVKG